MDDLDAAPRSELDARAWFYLDHRRDIEEWAGLRAEARQLLHTRLLGLGPLVEQLATDMGAQPYEADLEPGDRPRIGLRREAWVWNGHQVAVVVEWQYAKLLNPEAANQWPYVAVRNDGGGADPARRQHLERALADLRRERRGQMERHGRSGGTSSHLRRLQ